MPCDILDLRCVFVNELVGSIMLSILFVAMIYFIIASKLRLGFETTIAFAFPLLLLTGVAIGSLSSMMAFLTVIVAFMLALLFNKLIGNR